MVPEPVGEPDGPALDMGRSAMGRLFSLHMLMDSGIPGK